MEIVKTFSGTTTNSPHTFHKLMTDGQVFGTVTTTRAQGIIDAFAHIQGSRKVLPATFSPRESVEECFARMLAEFGQ